MITTAISSWVWWALCVLMAFAALFQIITTRCKVVGACPMVKWGKRTMASGFALASLFYFYRAIHLEIAVFITWGAGAFALVALGSIFANVDRFIRGQENAIVVPPTGNLYDVSNYIGPERRDRSLLGRLRRWHYSL